MCTPDSASGTIFFFFFGNGNKAVGRMKRPCLANLHRYELQKYKYKM